MNEKRKRETGEVSSEREKEYRRWDASDLEKRILGRKPGEGSGLYTE
jgi:hypothetical protein